MRVRCACGAQLSGARDGRSTKYCVDCKRKMARAKQQRHRESGKRALAERRRYTAEGDRGRARLRAKWAKLRTDVIAGYGGRCACCGEEQSEFLTLDHVDGNGSAERRRHGPRAHLLAAKREGFPDRFQVLCWNCNSARHLNGGVCPHEREIARVLAVA